MSEHPKDRPPEPTDPFQMFAAGVEGDPELMLTCLVEEYSRLGYDAEGLVALFDDPEFLATHGLSELLGPEETRERVLSVLARCGVLRVTAHVLPPENPSACQGN